MNCVPRFILMQQGDIDSLCSELGVRELCVFGSALREDFDPKNSDIDFLVDFNFPDQPGIADRYFKLADGLEKIFQRPVDLVTRQSIKNPVFKQTLHSTSQTLYAA